MHFANWSWIVYMGLGICLGIAGFWSFERLKFKRIPVRWYDWTIAAFEVFLLGFMVQNFFGSYAEGEPQAAWLCIVFIGSPIVVLGVVLTSLVAKRKPSAAVTNPS